MNKAQLAKHFRVSTKTIDDWTIKGCPHRRTTRGGYDFDPKAVAKWRSETAPIRKGATGISLMEARTRKEVALAGLRELQLKERSGELVLRRAVNDFEYKTARMLRDNLFNIPDRIAGQCAKQNQETIHRLMTEEIRQTLEIITNDPPTADTTPAAV